jgi:hypothetical protein
MKGKERADEEYENDEPARDPGGDEHEVLDQTGRDR